MDRFANSEFGNMKKSSEWVRQPGLDKMLDQLVEERGCTPAELVPYDAAKALGIEPSGEFYKKVRDWKQRRAAERDEPIMEVPPHVQAEFRESLDRFTGEAMNNFLNALRMIGGDFNRNATLRIADAERRAGDAQAGENAMLDLWAATEAERDAALVKVAELNTALSDSRHREEVMTVRLQERDALLKALRLETTENGPAAVTPPMPGGDAAHAGDDRKGLIADAAVKPDQPPAIEAEHPQGAQGVMPLVTQVADDQADVAGGAEG